MGHTGTAPHRLHGEQPHRRIEITGRHRRGQRAGEHRLPAVHRTLVAGPAPNSCCRKRCSWRRRSRSAAPGRAGNVVQVAVRVGFLHVDGGGHDAVAHGQQGGGHTGGAARALRVADQAFQRGARQLVGMPVEGQFHGARLDAVVQLRRGAVIVDVLDVRGRDAGFVHRHAHGARRLLAALLQPHPVVGFAGGTLARRPRRRCGRRARARAPTPR